MAAPKIGDRRAGEGVGKLNAAHVSAAQIRPLERIVRKHPALGDVHLRAQQQRFGVYYALTGKTAAVEDIHAHLAAKHTVWLKSAASGENACKIGRNGRGQRCAHARMYDAVPGGDKSALAVEHRQIHRMQHCADKLAHRAGRGHGVAVEGEDIARRAQKLSVAAACVQLAIIAAHELCKLQQRAALALKAGVFSAPLVERSLARKKIKSAAVFLVQRVDSALGRRNDRLVLGHGLRFCLSQVGKYAHEQIFAAVAVCKIKLLQKRGKMLAAFLVREQRRYYTHRPPLIGNAAVKLEPRQAARRNAQQNDVIEHDLRKLRQRQEQQRRGNGAAR